MGITAGIVMHRSGRYLELIYIGVITLVVGNGLFILFNVHSNLATIIPFELIAGIGGGSLFATPLIALQAMVRQDEVATATGTLGFVRNLATSLGVVIGGVIFQNGMDNRSSALSAAGVSTDLVKLFSGPEAEANVVRVRSIQNSGQKLLVKEAYAWSLSHLWIFYCCTAACGLISSVFIMKTKLSDIHVETKTGLKKNEERSSGGEDVEIPRIAGG